MHSYFHVAFESQPEGVIMTLSAYQQWRATAPAADKIGHLATMILPAYAEHFGYIDVADDGAFVEYARAA